MMTGSLISDGEPVLPVNVMGLDGSQDIEAVIDTGFNGELTLPQE